ncbi:MAG: aldose epimerase family protein [Tateyamaria sp.]|uniref:aldose epimerase family protein n=1 Tax=Tateyamaria sp. TaxID=1929288 RepID=UPI00329DA2A6
MSNQITIGSDRLRATLSRDGARLETLHLDGGPSLVLYADADQHPEWRDCYPGAIVGPIANRVRGGAFDLDGRSYQMPCNENGVTALHSGPDGIDRQDWALSEQQDSLVAFRLELADGKGGLPSARQVDVVYEITEATLRLEVSMTTERPTPAAFAHHPYWRLGHASAHKLQINATHYLPIDAQNLPTGALAPVANTAFDHRTAAAPHLGIDHNFCISNTRVEPAQPVATLTGADGLRLRIDSTEPGLQVYAGAFLPTLPGTGIEPGAGLALEPQGWPDTVNHQVFPSVLCTPERPYRQITLYHLDTVT